MDCSLYGTPVAGCQTPTIPTQQQMAMLSSAMSLAMASAQTFPECEYMVSAMSMMIDYTYFVDNAFRMKDPSTGDSVTAGGDHHYGAVGSQSQIHLATRNGSFAFSAGTIENIFAHEAWHSFTTSDAESSFMANRCVPSSGATPPPPQQ